MELDSLTEAVWPDVVPCVQGGFALTGSAAYRLLINDASIIVRDVDFIVYPKSPTNVPFDPAKPSIKRSFYIAKLAENPRGYRYGLVHKSTYGWVDLFPRIKKPRTTWVTTTTRPIEVEALESICFGLCISVLERSETNQRILKSSLDKIKFLGPLLNTEVFNAVCRDGMTETTVKAAAIINKYPGISLVDFINQSIKPHEPASFDLFDNNIKTPRGLSVEPEEDFREFMKKFSERWAKVL